MNQFKFIAEHLRAMGPDMKRLGDAIEQNYIPPTHMCDVVEYIQQASLVQCKTIVDALVERVSSLVGCATELEDASCVISCEIARGGDE